MALTSDRGRVAHLLRRGRLRPSEQEIAEYTQLGFDGAVSRLVNYEAMPEAPDRVTPEEAGLQRLVARKMVNTTRPAPGEDDPVLARPPDIGPQEGERPERYA